MAHMTHQNALMLDLEGPLAPFAYLNVNQDLEGHRLEFGNVSTEEHGQTRIYVYFAKVVSFLCDVPKLDENDIM